MTRRVGAVVSGTPARISLGGAARTSQIGQVAALPSFSRRITTPRPERKRLEERTQARAAPMEEEAASVDGRPPGEEGQPRGGDASSKRARVSPPETG